jgi:hypothetical protein
VSAHWLALLLILAAFALRTHRLGNKAMWWDEGFSVFLARMPLTEMMDATAHDTHPPVYYAALHFWRMAVGDSEVALRLLSVLAGLLLLPLAFRLVRSLAGPHAALCALGLLGLSRVLIWYAQEVRQYSLAACLALASAVLALTLWRSNSGWRYATWWGYVAVNVAGLLTLYLFSSALVAGLALAIWRANKWQLMRQRSNRHTWPAFLALVLLARAPHTVPYLTTAEVIKLYAARCWWAIPLTWIAIGAHGWGGGLLPLAAGGWRLPDPSAILAAGDPTLVPLLLVWLLNLLTGLKLSFQLNPRYFVVLAPWALCLLASPASYPNMPSGA